MKIYRFIVPVLLFFWGVNLYGENEGVNGFNTGNCQGVSLWAPSLEALLRKTAQPAME
ncbi:MAG: hypothetical protein OXG88_01250 [Gammaproteobacteria bacterium]|nr:hypothetical protein [Gammaproteobacteria bacterium]